MPKKKLIMIGLDAVSTVTLDRFAAEGAIPHIARLMETGSVYTTLPSIYAYTPTNWTVLATGAHPGTAGSLNWESRARGDVAPAENLSMFDRRAVQVGGQDGCRYVVAASFTAAGTPAEPLVLPIGAVVDLVSGQRLGQGGATALGPGEARIFRID